MGDEGIWRQVVAQVAVIGASRPWQDRLAPVWDAEGMTWSRLTTAPDLRDEATRAMAFHALFARHGVRYVGDGRIPAAKALACARNFESLRAAGGPHAWAVQVSQHRDEASRIRAVRGALAQVGSKGARDLLMDLGMSIDTIALDSRVMGTLHTAGVTKIKKPTTQAAYAALEAEVIRELAVATGLKPIEVDRTLYQRSQEIRERLARSGMVASG